tara:strand:+ start:1465 stop:2010 length:546 start_codon:yes stop_codon:yes gene_type:complete
MSQKIVDIVRGIGAASSNMFDGASDEKGEPIKIGLKREDGNPMLDKRVIDGCKVRCNGKTLIVSYHSELLLKDVYSQKLEDELEQTMSDIVSYLKKQYRKITGNTLSLKEKGEVDARVEKTSRVRVFVTASKQYEISSMTDVENIKEPSKDGLEKDFRNFLDQGGWDGPRPKNDKRKKTEN